MSAPRAKLYAAFAAVWLIWGSTYLAIRYALESLPPFTMAGIRFLVAGAILYAWARAKGAGKPKAIEWRSAFIIGAALLFLGNGGVVLAEQRIPSGLAALLICGTPMWMTLFDWLRTKEKPKTATMLGLIAGIAGVGILVSPADLGDGHSVDTLGAAMVLVGSFAWSSGSLYARHAPLPSSPFLASGMEMLAGGALLFGTGLVRGELFALSPSAITEGAILALIYLIVAGSLLGFTSYVWLLNNTTPARATTYAYVNPVIAVILGWAIAGEPMSSRMLIAGAVIVGALILITTSKSQR